MYILIIIDHASRFMLAETSFSMSAAHVVSVLEDRWCSVFQAPLAILTDRGGEFRSTVFRDYVTKVLGSFHVFSSAYYPQGNAVNEAAHRPLEASISTFLRESSDFPAAVRNAVRVHNATPHSSTGVSPYFFLFGMEPVFPGWQHLNPVEDDDVRCLSRLDQRLRHEVLARTAHRARSTSEENPLLVGDWVVFPYGEREQARAGHPLVSSGNYYPSMSLLAKIIEIRDNNVTVQLLGQPSARREVSKSVCRKITPDLPPTLVPLARDAVEFEAPRLPRYLNLRSELPLKRRVPWEDLSQRPAKVLRVTPIVVPPLPCAKPSASCEMPVAEAEGESLCRETVKQPL